MVHSIYSGTRPERTPTIWKHTNLTVEKKKGKVTERLQRFLLNGDTHSTKQDTQHGQDVFQMSGLWGRVAEVVDLPTERHCTYF